MIINKSQYFQYMYSILQDLQANYKIMYIVQAYLVMLQYIFVHGLRTISSSSDFREIPAILAKSSSARDYFG